MQNPVNIVLQSQMVTTHSESETFGASEGSRLRGSCLLWIIWVIFQQLLSHIHTDIQKGPVLGTEISQSIKYEC